jgi:predicted RNase H-like HicB family nuclease
MPKVRIIYHHEDEGWWAISPDLPDLVVAGDSAEEVRELVEDGLGDGYEVEHLYDEKLSTQAMPRHLFVRDLIGISSGIVTLTGLTIKGNDLTDEPRGVIASKASVITQ